MRPTCPRPPAPSRLLILLRQRSQVWPEHGQPVDRASASPYGVGAPWEKRAHERSLVAQDTTAVISDAIGCGEVGIVAEQPAIPLVRRQTGEAEQGQGLVACS